MPHPRPRVRRLLVRALFLLVVGWALAIVRSVRSSHGWDDWSDDTVSDEPPGRLDPDQGDDPESASEEKAAARSRPFRGHRLATSAAFVMLFFAGAAFTAGAGDQLVQAIEGDASACLATAKATGEDPAELCAAEPAAAPEAAPEAAASEQAAPETSPEAAPDAGPESSEAVEAAAPDALATPAPALVEEDLGPVRSATPAVDATSVAEMPDVTQPAPRKRSSRHWVVRRAKASPAAAPHVEDEGGASTVWLNRALPDPTPPAKRLSPRFARQLKQAARAHGVHWALVLAVLRAEGARGAKPATAQELDALAKGLRQHGAPKHNWNAVLAISGRTGFADRAVALANFNRAVGLNGLVKGLEAVKPVLVRRLLRDQHVQIYGGGREDLRLGRIDVRVVVLIRYLRATFGQVTVSSLFSGHRLYSRPGVVSAHIYGHAVDVAGLGELSIIGNQEPGGLTEKAVRSILMLPVEVQPRQVISLLGLGGASFPLADHGDHIHVGY
jgi:hypothetical protein